MATSVADELLTVSDYKRAASRILPTPSIDYFSEGADDQETLNKRAFQDYTIRPSSHRDVSTVCLSTSFLCNDLAHPIGISPTAFQKIADPAGEFATIRGAKATNSLMIAASCSSTALKGIKRAAGWHPMWVQLDMDADRRRTKSIIRRAEAAGYSAIVITADTPPALGRGHLTDSSTAQQDASLTWTYIRKLVGWTFLPVIVKGIMRAEDAVQAARHGAMGIIVSNHGGRLLDAAPATIHALREVVDTVQGKVPVWMDGGVRDGRDVFKALALGASGVFVGRPVLWGLTVAGEDGVANVLDILKRELEQTMIFTGCPTIDSIREVKDIVKHKSLVARI